MTTQAPFEKKYRVPVAEAVRLVCLKHPECKHSENRKLLIHWVQRFYSRLFNEACNSNSRLVDELLTEVPDSDSILRCFRDMHNTEGRLPVAYDSQEVDTSRKRPERGLFDFDS